MIWILAFIFVLPFSFVVMYGAPYLPTRKKQIREALKMLDLKKGDLLVDLGCGDGSVLLAAAKKGIKGIGYELNPYVYMLARIRLWRYRRLVTVKLQNYWNITIPKETAGIFVFLLDKYMAKLDKKLTSEVKKGTKVVSYTFEIPGKKANKKNGAMNLYIY